MPEAKGCFVIGIRPGWGLGEVLASVSGGECPWLKCLPLLGRLTGGRFVQMNSRTARSRVGGTIGFSLVEEGVDRIPPGFDKFATAAL